MKGDCTLKAFGGFDSNYSEVEIHMGVTATQLTESVVRVLRANSSRIKSYQVVADFCDVAVKTATDWMGGGKPLGGVKTLKLWHFLDALDIEQPELADLRKKYSYGAYVGELLAYDVVSLQEACQFGISPKGGGAVDDNAILRAARGEGRIMSERLSLDQLKEMYGDALHDAKQRLKDKLMTWGDTLSASTSMSLDQTNAITSSEETDGQQAPNLYALEEIAKLRELQKRSTRFVISGVAEKLRAAHAATEMALNDFTPAERSLLREEMGELMFELSNFTAWLCSERARQSGME